MNLVRKLLLGALLGCLPATAQAACGSLPYVYTNGVSIVDASTTNANNNFLLGCITTVDSSQIGTAGIFASQIAPNSVGTATFGGIYGYRFAPASPSQPILSIFGASGQTGDLFDVFSASGATKYDWIDSAGGVHTQSVNAATLISGPISATDIQLSSARPISSEGAYLQWNRTGNGATFLVNQRGFGAGGFVFGEATNSDVFTQTASLSPTGTLTATQFSGSGAGLTAGSVPNAALVTAPITQVAASGNLASSGGTTPVITMTGAPTFASVSTPTLSGVGQINQQSGAYSLAVNYAGGATGGLAVFNGSSTGKGPLTAAAINATSLTATNTITANLVSGATIESTGSLGADNGSIYLDNTLNHYIRLQSGQVNFADVVVAPTVRAANGASSASVTADGTNGYIITTGSGVLFVRTNALYIQNQAGTVFEPIVASAFNVGSDRRLKRDIVPVADGLAAIDALRPVRFKWRSSAKRDIGFIAQAVKSILPEVVSRDPHGTYMLNYSGIIPVLVRAVQQQQAEIDALKRQPPQQR